MNALNHDMNTGRSLLIDPRTNGEMPRADSAKIYYLEGYRIVADRPKDKRVRADYAVAFVLLVISIVTMPINFSVASIFGLPAFVYLLSQPRKS